MENISANKAINIAVEFFKHSFAPFDIEDTVLQNDTWLVKGHVNIYGMKSDRILTIDSKTGNIVSCE